MGRRPCCEKMELKKGPWNAEEDQLLINYITLHGHSNWRSIPKLAGLLRCGKSCRLRWINYLRPDIKRGNFTPLEEDTIINLHKILGNRWSAIAAKLPGRTDNEIKNVWHTHLKKRLHNKNQSSNQKTNDGDKNSESIEDMKWPISQQQQSSSISAVTTSGNNKNDMSNNNKDSATSSKDVFASIDESFWSEVVSMDCQKSGDEMKNEEERENWEDSLDRHDKGFNCLNHDFQSWFDLRINGQISDITEF